jgi:hypothetical protein
MNEYTLVLVDADSQAELAEARDFITAQGGKVAIVLPPRAIMGWVAPDVGARIIGRYKIRSIHRSPLQASANRYSDRETQIAINIFNEIASGARARRTLAEIRVQAEARADLPPMFDCALPRPDMNRDDYLRNLLSLGITPEALSAQSEIEPRFFDNSNIMDGTVAVALFLVESNGSIDPDALTWSQADQTTAVSRVIDGLNWWVDQSRAFNLPRPLQFTLVPFLATNPVCQQPYEPIFHNGRDAGLWIDRIMNNLGVSSGDIFVRVGSFDTALKNQNRTDWAFSIFMAYNPAPQRTSFIDGRASWAYLGGPHINALFRSFGWPLNQLISHEVGHIFYACDEYSQPGFQTCSCSCAPEVRPNALNGNCEESSCNRNSTACMMRINEFGLCQYTVAQIGWTATVPRPIPPAPAGLVAAAPSPTSVNLIWQDTSTTEDGFQIERRGGSDGSFSQIAVVGPNATHYSDTSALPNTAYAYRVRAFNSTGASTFSAEAAVVTPSTTPALAIATSDLTEATVNVPYSRNLVAIGGKPDYSWLIESGSLPAGLTISQSGNISGTPTTASGNTFTVRVTDAEGNRATRGLSLTVKPAAPLTITTRELPRGSVGVTYSQNLGASGGQTPYTWAIQSGSLPEGLTLNQTSGNISGTPERAGATSFALRLTDVTGASVTSTLSIVINPAIIELLIETLSLPDGVVGQEYSQPLRAIGGSAPYRWEMRQGRLPDGLEMTEAGLIRGRPTAVGELEFEVRVLDQSGQSAIKLFEIDIDPAPELTILSQTPLPVAAIGVPYRVELTATAGTAPYRWTKKKKKKFGTLPDGITLSSDGILAGTPTVQSTFNFTIQVSDSVGKKASKPLSIEVGPPPPPLAIHTEALPNATQTLPYNGALEATGGVQPYTWSLDTGALPDGLTLAPTGAITGRATSLGSTTFIVRVKDSLGTSSTKALFIIVVPPPPPLVIQTVSLPETSAERSYTQTLSASGGLPPYSWSLASGSLGQGLNLSSDGTISGTPLSPGTSVFVVRVTDSAQQTANRTLAIKINPADKLAPFGNLETPDFRVTLSNTATGSGWALDNIGVVAIEVLVDGEKVANGVYGSPRPDIAVVWGHFPSGGNSGFNFTFDTTKLTNGEHRLSVRVLDAAGNATIMGTRPFQVQNRVLVISTTALSRGKKNEFYSAQLIATNGQPPYRWELISGTPPSGISLNAAGVISGTPTGFGTVTLGVRVTDSTGAAAVASLTLTILPDVEPLSIQSRGDLTLGTVNIDYTHQLLFAGGRAPRRWGASPGALPPGLSLNPDTGVISGKPTRAGVYTFTVTLSDSTPTSDTSQPLIITIAPAAGETISSLSADAADLLDYGLATVFRWDVALPEALVSRIRRPYNLRRQ